MVVVSLLIKQFLLSASYPQYCCVPVQACIVHHDGTTPHAAASSLGIMLNKVCIKEGVALVNIVRKQEQVDLLTKLGAKFVVNSSSESFKKDLYKAIDATGATLAFDAIGGGELAGDILATMEAVGSKEATGFNTYGSVYNKQVPIFFR
ncbi:Alcohol dehydrogenase GroES-like, fragment [Oleispira antarctica RB-8]|uniref:Alcohol dehydrogenase GroES-like n=1 Tax=Oleispira antarctica RB-8 TaxID=698738 RepID=R4YU50_OLEAN|nr:Alcohol dehydrogenase GroES-like, fragment [Oleispira antarctica RB-8]